jgi:bacterioferritin
MWGEFMINTAFIDDLCVRRTSARQCMIKCSQEGDEQSLQAKLVSVLNEALAIQLIYVLRFKAHDSGGDLVKFIDSNQRERSNPAQLHADRLANRIAQLGGIADFNPPCLVRRDYRDYMNTGSLPDIWREDLIAHRIVVDIFREMVRYVAARDRETRQILEGILADEKQQADMLTARIASLVNRDQVCRAAV